MNILNSAFLSLINEIAFTNKIKELVIVILKILNYKKEEIEKVLATCHRELAAVVMEPLVQGASGIQVMPKGYLAHVARLCQQRHCSRR